MEIEPIERRRRALPAMHPGGLLREDVLPALGLSQAELAGILGIPEESLRAVLSEEDPVTVDLALRLGKLCGNGPALWINLQTRYDLDRLSRSLARELAEIPTVKPRD